MATSLAPSFEVLLVEDHPVQRMDAAEALRAVGLQVVEAPDVDAAIGVLARHRSLRVMMVDVELGSGTTDGLMLARVAAASAPWMGILVVSGVREPSAERLAPGARFLRKPYGANELADAVLSLANRRAGG